MDKNREYFIIENHSIIKKVRIIKFIGGLYTINIEGTSKYLRVHPSRIYSTYTDASGGRRFREKQVWNRADEEWTIIVKIVIFKV